MEITADEIIPVSRLVRNFSHYLNQLKERKITKLLLARQSGLEAVLIPVKDYERLLEVQEYLDHQTLFNELKEREKRDSGKRIPRKKLKQKYGLDN